MRICKIPGREIIMNKFMQIFRKMFKAGTYGECLNAVKSRYGAVGDAIYREPGVMVYKKKGTEDILRITLHNYHPKSKPGSGSRGIRVETLLPKDTTYQQYLSKVGKQSGFIKERSQVGPHRMIQGGPTIIQEVSPERYENRFAEGGLSLTYNYNGKSYFWPSTICTI